ncbi:MAG: hypothetical protein WDZ80_03380 [Candidatus Paceibacterota bacterium]
MEEVTPGQWISLGTDPLTSRDAVVCRVYEEGRIEVVYLDRRDRAINEDAIWNGERWVFENPGPGGGYADNYNRLGQYVRKLRAGRYN